ncbi:MAG: hypothetical protein ACYTEQ_25560 [Planctomycetota bacterium]|jgi:hypothetical protein
MNEDIPKARSKLGGGDAGREDQGKKNTVAFFSSEENREVAEDFNARFIQMVSYFLEWAKHIITIASGIMLLSVAFLKDVVSDAEFVMRWILVAFLAIAFLCLLASIGRALRFISTAAGSVMGRGSFIATPELLADLKKMLIWTQWLFWFGVLSFAAFAICALLSWSLTAD